MGVKSTTGSVPSSTAGSTVRGSGRDQKDHGDAVAAGDEVFAEPVEAVPQIGARRGINRKDHSELSPQLGSIDPENDEVFESEIEGIAVPRSISAHGDDATVIVTDDPAGAAIATWARAPDLLDDAPGRSQIRFGERPFVLKESPPFQALRPLGLGCSRGPSTTSSVSACLIRSPGRS